MELVYLLITSLILTIGIESLAGFLIGIRNKKDMTLLLLVNVVTNPPVVLICYLARSLFSGRIVLVKYVLEILAVIVEGGYYRKYGDRIRHPWLVSILLNSSSYWIGTLLK